MIWSDEHLVKQIHWLPRSPPRAFDYARPCLPTAIGTGDVSFQVIIEFAISILQVSSVHGVTLHHPSGRFI